MKYPFQKKSFWIILVVSFSIIFLFPPIIGFKSIRTPSGCVDFIPISDWKLLFAIEPNTTIRLTILIFEIVLVFLINYLGHLIFSKPEINKGDD